MRFEKLSRDSQSLKQSKLLEKSLKLASSETSFYSNIAPHIEAFPLTSKEDLQNQKNNFLTSQKTGTWRTTSGSSGKMVSVFWDQRNLIMRFIFMYRAFSMLGLNPVKRFIYALPDKENTAGTLGLFPHRHISLRDPLEQSLDTIKNFDPYVLSIYPSFAADLAEHLNEPLKSLQAISLNSEMTLPYQKKIIEERFGCPTYEEYSTTELGVVAAMCLSGQMHIFTDNVFLETVDEKGQPTLKGEPGEIVGTTLQSFGMPLIRYRTGDIGQLDFSSHCACGRSAPILKSLEGRSDDYLLNSDLERVAAWRIYEAIERPTHEESLFKDIFLEQRSPGSLELQFIPGAKYNKDIDLKIEKEIKGLFGMDATIQINQVDKINRPDSIKRKYIYRHDTKSKD